MYGVSHHDVMFSKAAVAAPPDDDSAKGGAQYISGRVRTRHDIKFNLLLPHPFPLLCGVDVSYETPSFSLFLQVLT